MNKLQTKTNFKEFLPFFLSSNLFFSWLSFSLQSGIWSYIILLFKRKLHKPLKHAREANFLQSLLAI